MNRERAREAFHNLVVMIFYTINEKATKLKTLASSSITHLLRMTTQWYRNNSCRHDHDTLFHALYAPNQNNDRVRVQLHQLSWNNWPNDFP